MSRRKCCCKSGDVDPPPKPDDSKCTEPQLYTTESINYDFSDDCKPRFNDGFKEDTDFCNNKDIFNVVDQNEVKINDNYLGKHYSYLQTRDAAGAGAPSFYRNIPGGGQFRATGQGVGIVSKHYFNVNTTDVYKIGYQLDASIDQGFERFGRTDIDRDRGWGNLIVFRPVSSNAPYPKDISMQVKFGGYYITASSLDYRFDGFNWSLGLPYDEAYYKTRVTIAGQNNIISDETINTPLSHYYNSMQTIAFNFNVTNVEYTVNNSNPRVTFVMTTTIGGGVFTFTDTARFGPCMRNNYLYATNLKSKGIKVKGSDNTTGTNNYTTYPDALNLTGVYPDIAFCFSAMDNFIWEPTIV